jgi:transposase
MDERLRFVARLLDGEKMAALCREYDVSRKTGYKIFQRYKDYGLDGLTDRSRWEIHLRIAEICLNEPSHFSSLPPTMRQLR